MRYPTPEEDHDRALLDAAGRRRSTATVPEFHARRPPATRMRYPADPPTIEEIVAVSAPATTSTAAGCAAIVVLWRAGLRIHKALALAEADLDPRRGALLARRGKGGRRRPVGMDDGA